MRRPVGHSARMAAVLLAALVMTAGCTLVDGKDTVGEIVTSWSQGTDQRIGEFAPKGTLVLADDASRRKFLSRLPDKLDASAVEAADLTQDFLVLGSYSKCMQHSRVWMDSKRTRIWFDVYLPREHRNTNCGWAPLTVDVWRVPRSELRTIPVDRLRTEEPS